MPVAVVAVLGGPRDFRPRAGAVEPWAGGVDVGLRQGLVAGAFQLEEVTVREAQNLESAARVRGDIE